MQEKIREVLTEKMSVVKMTDTMLKLRENLYAKAITCYEANKQLGFDDSQAFENALRTFNELDRVLADLVGVSCINDSEDNLSKFAKQGIIAQIIIWSVFLICYIVTSVCIGNWLLPLVMAIIFIAISFTANRVYRNKRNSKTSREVFRN